jgi:hypothetical protein
VLSSRCWCLGSVTVVRIVNKRVAEISFDQVGGAGRVGTRTAAGEPTIRLVLNLVEQMA